jgi:FMN phosphatase YigB (HAD superfamily)
MIKVIAFDLFGTVFDMSGVSRQEIRNYINHINKDSWSPLVLSKAWECLPAFEDSAPGIEELRENFTVLTCTNAPLGTQIKLCKNNGVLFDGYIPLELSRAFKTRPQTYKSVYEIMNIEPEEMMMVTANKTFGDLEASKNLGINPVFIRHDSKVKNIEHLAMLMGNYTANRQNILYNKQ